jgi:hypothetical protein
LFNFTRWNWRREWLNLRKKLKISRKTLMM